MSEDKEEKRAKWDQPEIEEFEGCEEDATCGQCDDPLDRKHGCRPNQGGCRPMFGGCFPSSSCFPRKGGCFPWGVAVTCSPRFSCFPYGPSCRPYASYCRPYGFNYGCPPRGAK